MFSHLANGSEISWPDVMMSLLCNDHQSRARQRVTKPGGANGVTDESQARGDNAGGSGDGDNKP